MIAVMALTILTATQGDTGSQVSGWADVSTIWLILPVMMVALLVAVLLFALVYLLARALRVLPVYTGLVQQYAALAAEKVKYFADKLVSPIMGLRSLMTAANKVVGKIIGHKNR